LAFLKRAAYSNVMLKKKHTNVKNGTIHIKMLGK
jgi:hypothetical protein